MCNLQIQQATSSWQHSRKFKLIVFRMFYMFCFVNKFVIEPSSGYDYETLLDTKFRHPKSESSKGRQPWTILERRTRFVIEVYSTTFEGRTLWF